MTPFVCLALSAIAFSCACCALTLERISGQLRHIEELIDDEDFNADYGDDSCGLEGGDLL